MRRSELYDCLAHPEHLGPDHLESVRQLAEAYPWCATFAHLYLRCLALCDDVRYPSELRRLAILLPDREALYREVELRRQPSLPPPEEASEESFDLIDHFLSGARSSGEDLPEELSYEGGAEAGDYFSSEELQQSDGAESLLPELENPSPSNSPQSEPSVTAPRPWLEESPQEGLLSETLSRIYIQQGHYDKALRIIRSLSLNYPEKNRYFADQLRFLERLTKHINSK